MPIVFNCPCGKALRVGDESAGKRVKCPACHAVGSVPSPEPDFEIIEDEPEEKLVSKPAAKKTAAKAIEEDEEDDKPRAKKKPVKARKSRDDEDDENEDDADQPRKRGASGSNSGKQALYLLGGLLMVGGGIGLAVFGWQGSGRSSTRAMVLGILLVICGIGTAVRGITGDFDDK